MKETIEKRFASHILRYVGIGLISGSMVHIGTLGGETTRYIILISLGIVAFITGIILEKGNRRIELSYITLSVVLAIGVGMVSGGTQHYLDGPVYASFLIPIGLCIGYVTYVVIEDKKYLNFKKVFTVIITSLILLGGLYSIAHRIPPSKSHHNEELGH